MCVIQKLKNQIPELCASWTCESTVRVRAGAGAEAGAWRVWAGGAGGYVAAAALNASLAGDPNLLTPASAYQR